ncbi:MAG: type II secretion system F family protein, partial [Candidatus Methanomethyliaceae archaeon]|nr:type II secretion system F family protein [Candidatus Methanomethyliaceae archaeon]
MPFVRKNEKYLLYIISIASGLIIILIALQVYPTNTRFGDYLVTVSIMTMLFPIGMLNYLEYKWRKAIEERMPDLLYDIAEGQITGMSFIRALQTATSKEYGVMSIELKKVLAQVKLGMSFEEAIRRFAERTDSQLVRRVGAIISDVNRFGGDIVEVVRSLADYIKMILTISEERRTAMRTYIGISYIAFGVLLVIVAILLNQFFLPTLQLGTAPLFISPVGYEEYRRAFFFFAITQAIFSGLVTGKLGEGSIFAGLKHIVIMLFLTLI